MSDDYDSDAREDPRPYISARRRRPRYNSEIYATQDSVDYLSRSTPRTAEHTRPQNPSHFGLSSDLVESPSHYTHSSSRPDDPISLYGQTHVSGYEEPPGYQPGTSRQHPSAYSVYARPTAHLSPPRASFSGGSVRPHPGHPEYLPSQGTLDPRYTVQPSSYYRAGKVFSILWHENDGRGGNGTNVSVGPQFRGRFGEPIYSTIRRMVVIKVFDHCSWCFSISTYGGRGVAKPGVDASKHAIVHMADTAPVVGPYEPRIAKGPLEVAPVRYDEALDPMSRLNFGKIYTVEHNVKVLPIGEITPRAMTRFYSYARPELSI